jgi:hypothetical protein
MGTVDTNKFVYKTRNAKLSNSIDTLERRCTTFWKVTFTSKCLKGMCFLRTYFNHLPESQHSLSLGYFP